jgi:hypothetical protein
MKSWTHWIRPPPPPLVQLAIRRVDAIVGEKHRGAYERAAYLAIAATEVLERQGKGEESQHLLTLRDRPPSPKVRLHWRGEG